MHRSCCLPASAARNPRMSQGSSRFPGRLDARHSQHGLETLETRLQLAQQLEPPDVVGPRVGQFGAVPATDLGEEVADSVENGMSWNEAERRRELGIRALVVTRQSRRRDLLE